MDKKKRIPDEELAKVAGAGKPTMEKVPPPGVDSPEPEGEDLPDGGTQTPFQD